MPDEPAEPLQSLEHSLAELLGKGMYDWGPDPEACSQCGSANFIPIVYGLLTEEGQQRARNGEFAMGGCCFEPQRWFCRSCRHRWPDEWPPLPDPGPQPSEEEERAEQIQRSLERYARFTALAKEPPREPTAFVDRVLRRTTRPGDRSFGVRFSWGRAIVEKKTALVDEGGAPEFSVWVSAHWHNPPRNAPEREAEAVAVALRHVERYGDAPYTATDV